MLLPDSISVLFPTNALLALFRDFESVDSRIVWQKPVSRQQAVKSIPRCRTSATLAEGKMVVSFSGDEILREPP